MLFSIIRLTKWKQGGIKVNWYFLIEIGVIIIALIILLYSVKQKDKANEVYKRAQFERDKAVVEFLNYMKGEKENE